MPGTLSGFTTELRGAPWEAAAVIVESAETDLVKGTRVKTRLAQSNWQWAKGKPLTTATKAGPASHPPPKLGVARGLAEGRTRDGQVSGSNYTPYAPFAEQVQGVTYDQAIDRALKKAQRADLVKEAA